MKAETGRREVVGGMAGPVPECWVTLDFASIAAVKPDEEGETDHPLIPSSPASAAAGGCYLWVTPAMQGPAPYNISQTHLCMKRYEPPCCPYAGKTLVGFNESCARIKTQHSGHCLGVSSYGVCVCV